MTTTSLPSRILITKDEHEGGFYIVPQGNGDTARVEDPASIPEWAEGLAVADLKEHREFYIKRIGEEGYAAMTKDTLNYADLSWTAADQEGDLVAIEADHTWRSENLADVLGLEPFDELNADVEVASTMASQPADEKSLAEVEGKSFSDVEHEEEGKTAQG